MKENNKMLAAMSGGLDSSMAAYLMQKAGYGLTGIFMRLHYLGEEAERAARRACRRLGIKFYPLDLSHKFEAEVVRYFIESYAAGQTPNPCVKCNKKIKFGELIRIADEIGAYWLLTGHYAKNIYKNGAYRVYRPKDREKDQTYFLYNLNQSVLKRVKFPLGEYKKEEIKKEAEKIRFPHLKKESQDICFLAEDGRIISHNKFLQKHIKAKEGDIRLLSGEKIGRHKGLPFYTIGQRRGIEIGGTGPYYAVRMDYENNELIAAKDRDDPALYSRSLLAEKVNWLSGQPPKMPFECEIAVRYRHQPAKAVLKLSGKKISAEFEKPQRALASGQSAVFYDKEELLGGGIIISKK